MLGSERSCANPTPSSSPARPATSAPSWSPNCRRADTRSAPSAAAARAAATRARGDVLSGAGPARGARGRQRRPTTSSTRWAAGGDFAAKDRQAAVNFAEAAADAGVERVVYLGGLGAEDSEHLRSRHEVAQLLRARLGDTARVRARGDDHRPGQRVLRHPRAPRQAAAGDDRPALAGHEDAADRALGRGRGAGRRWPSARTRRTSCSSAAPRS